MQLNKVALADIHSFSPFFLDYIDQKKTLEPYFNRYPNPENFKQQLAEKSASFSVDHRRVLNTVLQAQYEGLVTSKAVSENIALLKNENTFTVTTGHQLNIFTGPLYFIFKIVTVINSCKKLKAQYPQHNFVPVYWMASEDHDYDEIKYFTLYGKKYVWNTNQTGAVGRFNTTGLDAIASDLPGDVKIFKEAYSNNGTLSHAVRHYVNDLFGSEGLIVLDADVRPLKALFKDVIKKDILQNSVKPIVEDTNDALKNLDYKTQIFCRDINFFYLDQAVRGRIEKLDDRFKVLDTDLSFSASEIERRIEEEPEKFSPNVILRPLFQEVILPNLAYVGGPAEVIYWLQLKKVFNHFGTPFPIVMPRNFGMIVNHEIDRKFSKTGLELKDFFEEKNYIFNHWILNHSSRNLTVGAERTEVAKIFNQLQERAISIDRSLGPFVSAEGQRALNSLEKIERKLIRAEKRLQTDKFRQIEDVKDALFPGGSLQERTDNFLNFYQQDSHFIQKLLDTFDPFDFQFNILRYNA
ncbi:MAG TPA: bacillithiol biosynthesis cysteine-adding enzyme BshC [Chryseolinea sp.]|nr:bacillithiol biosynthesis cysteine-adding enzyme BshC [Chryseolinea sp.]